MALKLVYSVTEELPHMMRRSFLQGIGAVAAIPLLGSAAKSQAGRGQRGEAPAGPQLPLRTTSLEHFGMVVPDVDKAGRFYGPIFNPELHKEAMEPLRYYVSMGIGYIALGANRQPDTPSRIDHYCALVDGYNAQAFRQELEAQGVNVAAGGVGQMRDTDGITPHLLGRHGRPARTTAPARGLNCRPATSRV